MHSAYHLLGSAYRYFKRYTRQADEECAEFDGFIGIEWDVLRGSAVTMPACMRQTADVGQQDDSLPSTGASLKGTRCGDSSSMNRTRCTNSEHEELGVDGLLLHFRREGDRRLWEENVRAESGKYIISCCRDCGSSLRSGRLPRYALANDLWAGPVPEELQGLTDAERLFISRGFTFTQLRTLPGRCHPANRQLKQQGHTVSFPQDSAQLLPILPLDLERVQEHISIYFTGPDRNVVRNAKQYVVRRSKVEGALMWLKAHNRIYADVEIDESLLSKLPEGDVPEIFVEKAVPDPDETDLREQGPDEATLQGENSPEDAATEDRKFMQGAVIDVEGADLDPIRLWQCALRATDKAQACEDAALRAARRNASQDQEDVEDKAAFLRAKAIDTLATLVREDTAGCETKKTLDKDCTEENVRKESAGGFIMS